MPGPGTLTQVLIGRQIVSAECVLRLTMLAFITVAALYGLP